MSLLKAIKAQLGLSNTPANNFTITAEADNGTLKLARGNAGATTQDILTVDAQGRVKTPQNLVAFSAFQSVGTTVPNGGSGAKVIFQQKRFDIGNFYDTTTGRFTPNIPGYYQLNTSVSYADAPIAASAIQVGLVKNVEDLSSAFARSIVGQSGGYCILSVSGIVYLNGTGDYACVVTYQNQGSNRVTQATQLDTNFSGILIQPA